jgi:hypothetical protein
MTRLKVRVSSLKFGNSLDSAEELLQFSQPNVQVAAIPPDAPTWPS